jgi:hypothetical protein
MRFAFARAPTVFAHRLFIRHADIYQRCPAEHFIGEERERMVYGIVAAPSKLHERCHPVVIIGISCDLFPVVQRKTFHI